MNRAQKLVVEIRALDSNADLDKITHDEEALTELRDLLRGYADCENCGSRVYADGSRECDSRCPHADGRSRDTVCCSCGVEFVTNSPVMYQHRRPDGDACPACELDRTCGPVLD